MSRTSWLIFLVFLFETDIFPHAAAHRIDSCHRSVRSSNRVSERKCEEYTRGTTCKRSYDSIDPTVVEDAEQGEFPHLAFLASNSTERINFAFVCTGSLISPQFVLTVATCASHSRYPLTFVSLGNHNINLTVDDGTKSVQVPIKAVHKHPSYRASKNYNNIALLELASEVTFNTNIRPACLWTENQISGHNTALIATIDKTLVKELRKNVTQKVSVTIKENDACNISSWLSRHWSHGIEDSQMCGQEATGRYPECKAIAGAPLQIILKKPNQCGFHVIGLTSYGSPLCDKHPTIFTRISSYVDWIESIVWPAE